LIDNFSELCNSFSEQEAHRLREILMTCADILWIGATAGTLEVSFRYQHAFYEFFKKYSLTGLNQEEMQNLLQRLAEINKQESTIKLIIERQPARVETLRILTGGEIRMIVVLFKILTNPDGGNAFRDLEIILDRVTPLYKDRMGALPILQREVVATLAKNWDSMASEELARVLRRPLTEVDAILAELKKANLVEIRVVDAQTQWYSLQERFFNIWYLMRISTTRGAEIKWLMHFFEAWYTPEELQQRAKQHIEALQRQGHYYPKAAYLVTEALAGTGKLEMDVEDKLKEVTKEFLDSRGDNLANELSNTDKEAFVQGNRFFAEGQYHEAVKSYLQIKNPDGEVFKEIVRSFKMMWDIIKLNQERQLAQEKDVLMTKWGKENIFEAQPEKALKLMSEGGIEWISKVEQINKIEAMNFLGWLHDNNGDYKKAEEHYKKAVSEGDIHSLYDLGHLYTHRLKNLDEAVKYYQQAIDKDPQPTTEKMIEVAWFYAYAKHDNDKAKKYYEKALELKPDFPQTMDEFGWFYANNLKDYKKAIEWFLEAIKMEFIKAKDSIVWCCFYKQKSDKATALKFAEEAFKERKQAYIAHSLACVYLWHNRFGDARHIENYFMSNKEELNNDTGVPLYLQLLLAKQQYEAVSEHFANPELKERFKPIYYAFLKLTDDPEFGRMPSELNETVEQVLVKIARMAEDYK